MSAHPNHPQLRLCGGPCGRMTRNSKMALTSFPGTVTRATGDRCASCHRLQVKAGEAPPTAKMANADALKAKKQEERQAAAHRVREAMLAERAARARRRMVRPVNMGQSMVRI